MFAAGRSPVSASPETAPEGRREGELVAGCDGQLVAERRGPAGRAGVAAQELVDRRELGADARRSAACGLDLLLGATQGDARRLGGRVGDGAPFALDRQRRLGLLRAARGRLAGAL